MGQANLQILLAGVEGEPDGDFLAFFERLAGGFLGRDHEELDLSEPELAVGLVGAYREDFLDGGQDSLRDERRAVRAFFDSA